MEGKLKIVLDNGKEIEIDRTAVFRAAGSVKSQKKAEAARINGLRGGAPRMCVRCKKRPPREGDTLCKPCEKAEKERVKKERAARG